ncbi:MULTISPECIES: ankyrin repeat domain-containing protein [unclassified Endozoicomonas]|uniref:ankyrin repeat domain-containing protein n=1 Tax=unclassified Endozoicomonas TaxID=2644528 RepID=UPI003BB5F402
MDAINLNHPPLPITTELTSEAHKCDICFVEFHGRDVAAVEDDSKCKTHCGHIFHLHCLTRLFYVKPIDSRSCGYCREKPFPVLDMKTGESHPDKFFPDQVFSRACLNGDVNQVKKSLAEGVYVNAVMWDDFNPLLIASAMGHTELAEVLINNGANVNAAMAENGVTPLFFAAQKNHTGTVKLLISKGAKLDPPQTSYGATPLSIAVLKNNIDCAKLLIKAGTNVNTPIAYGTVLHLAARENYTDIVKLLLEKGADLNARTKYGTTALFEAAKRGHIECLKLLIRAGADVNAALPDGSTPLSVATMMGHFDCVEAINEAKTRRTEEGLCIIL